MIQSIFNFIKPYVELIWLTLALMGIAVVLIVCMPIDVYQSLKRRQ